MKTLGIYYVILGLLAIILPVIFIANAIIFKRNGKTLIGMKFSKNTPEYQRMARRCRTRNISFAAVIGLIGAVNLAYIVATNIDSPGFRTTLITCAVLITTLIVVLMEKIKESES